VATAQKISQLTTAGPLTGAELVPVVQNSGTLQTTVSAISVFVAGDLQSSIDAVSARVDQVSALTSLNSVALASTNSTIDTLSNRVDAVSVSVETLNGQMLEVQASISAINSVLATIDTSAVVGLESRVSLLEIRVTDVSASLSALQVQVDAVSILTSINAAAITSVNNAVSVLEVRVSSVSALTSVNAAAITSINAVVSTKVNRVGDYMDSVQYIEFDTSTGYAVSVGRLTWDIEYGTLDIGLAGGNSNVLIGQREVMYVYNNTAATLEKGKVVEVTGAQGQRLTVKLAQADSDANSATVLGIMLETVSVNNSGYVATNGIVRNVDTGAFTDGQLVYLSPVSAGELTATKPVAPQHMVLIGYVVKGGSVGGGSVYIKTQNGYELGELHDVKTSASASIANNEVLAYNTSAGVWTNSTVLIETQASISVLQIQVDAVSAATSVNAARIAAVSASVSALQVQLEAVSAATSVNAVAIAAVSAAVSAALVSVSQRVLKAGDTMTGSLIIDVSNATAAIRITQNGSGNAIVVEDSTNPDSTPFVVDANGNVGIGTNTPDASRALTLNRAANYGGIEFQVSGSPQARIQQEGTGSLYIDCGIATSTGAMIFRTANNNERVRITNTGNVGIGVISPTARVHVSVSAGAQALTVVGNSTFVGPLVITSVSADVAAVSATGFIADGIGNVRDIPQNAKTAAYTLVTADAGKYIAITSGGITVPQNVFLPGNAISIFNNSANNQTITQGTSVTMYLAGTSLTGNRTIAQRGLATVLCVTSVVFVISGAGLT